MYYIPVMTWLYMIVNAEYMVIIQTRTVHEDK